MQRLNVKKNIYLLPVIQFFHGFNLISLILVLYMHELLNSYTLAMSIFSIVSISCAVFEVPTGVLSDRIGRAKTMSLNALFYLLSCICLYYAKFYNPLILLTISTILSGISISFSSGNNEALEYETMKQLKLEHRYPEFSGKLHSIQKLSFATASILSGYLAYKIGYENVVLLNLIPITIYLILSFFVAEPVIEEKSLRSSVSIFNALNRFKRSKKLRKIALSRVLTASTDTASNRFEPIYFATLVPVWAIGIVKFVKLISLSISYWFSGEIIEKIGDKKTLINSNILMSFTKLFSLLMANIISPFLYSISNLFYGTTLTSLSNLSQKEFSPSQRATMGSIISIFESFAMFIFTCIIGVIADFYNPQIALLVTIIPMAISIIIYQKLFSEKDEKDFEKIAAE